MQGRGPGFPMQTIRFLLFVGAAGLSAAETKPVVSPDRVVALVTSVEDYQVSKNYYLNYIDAPYGWEKTVIARIILPESLAGREIAIPYDSLTPEADPLCQKGALFVFQHRMNLSDLRNRTDWIKRSAIEFPRKGLTVFAIQDRPLSPAVTYLGR
jgi:hypothetical protein